MRAWSYGTEGVCNGMLNVQRARNILLVYLPVAVMVLLLGFTGVTVADSNAEHFNATDWESSGDGSHSVSNASTQAVKLSWDYGGLGDASWTYTTTAQKTGVLEVDWVFSGCHSWFNSDADAYIYANGPDGQTRTHVSDVAGCSFSDSGSHTVEIHEGYDFGVEVQGYHGDSSRIMRGDFTLEVSSATYLEFSSQPEDTAAGGTVRGSPAVELSDKFGNSTEGKMVNVTAVDDSLNSGTQNVTTNIDGIAEFKDLIIYSPGDYRLAFSSDGITIVSNNFSVREPVRRRSLGRGQDRSFERKKSRDLRRGELEERDDLVLDSGRNARNNRRDSGR